MGISLLAALCLAVPATAQEAGAAGTLPSAPAAGSAVATEAQAPAQAPAVITLDEAIRRAETADPTYAGAVAANQVSAADRTIARSAFLPSVRYFNQYLFTQSAHLPAKDQAALAQSGVTPAPAYIANNSVHEYMSQAQVTETVGLGVFAQYKRAGAAAIQASAEQEAARRALVVHVVNLYFSLLAADRKEAVAQRATDEASHFHDLTERLETAGEVAHADVVKAELQLEEKQRALSDATLAASRARLDLGVLLFPDPRTGYQLAETEAKLPAVPERADVQAAAEKNNPDLRSALAAADAANLDVKAAWAAYLPDLTLNYNYGIDAEQFAVNGRDGVHNLAYSTSVTLDIPVWDWFATQAHVRQAKAMRDVARTQLTNTQRALIAELDEFYDEARAASVQLSSLDQSTGGARKSLELTNLRYKAGEATVLEVVDAQNTLATAEAAQADGMVRYRAALASLLTLTGVLAQ
ncbi:TolC family protein [Acidipila sp. 4G-K13]|nr:TolC family protein [Paracidobacterium acidisoli]